MYFQWRKGRGGSEMFHGAVVDHDGRGDTRVFQDVTQVGEALEALQPLYETTRDRAKVCVIFDWDNWWAIDYAQTGQNRNMRYFDVVGMHYRSLWEQGISVDFRDMRDCTDLSGYKLVIAPMLFMFRNDFGAKLRAYVEQGGTLLTTYHSGIVDGDDLAYLSGVPHDLTDVLGVRQTELDALYPEDEQSLMMMDGRTFRVKELCALLEPLGAETLGTYGHDFYAGQPCLTKHSFGKGTAYYLAAKVEQAGLNAIYGDIAKELALPRALEDALPTGVVATGRGGAIFLQNYSGAAQSLFLQETYTDLITGEQVTGMFELPVNGVMVLQKA